MRTPSTRSRQGAYLTHGWLIGLTAVLFALLLAVPWWLAIVPAILIQNRVGILLHEYIHGIPFRRHRSNIAVLVVFDGLMMCGGLLELFRVTHLAHHRWLNGPGDPAHQSSLNYSGKSRLRCLLMLELPQLLAYLRRAITRRDLPVSWFRIATGFGLTLVSAAAWIAGGRPEIIVLLAACTVFNAAVSGSLRGAVEHHGMPGSAAFSNEYLPLIPMFNMNRHLHHHIDPGRPWYLLRYQTAAPLPRRTFFTHWIDVYVRRRFVMLAPPRRVATNGLADTGG
jgi:fatty acid desaturase